MLTAIILATAALAVVAVVSLRWDDVVHWFTARQNLKARDRDAVAFTLQEKLKSGKYRTVQGIFNKRTNTMVDVRKVESNDVSAEQKKAHLGEQLVVYE
jgi:hypothetical protein